jgi:hypothetical protein
MSAFMCSDRHISTLVNAATTYSIPLPDNCGTPKALFHLLSRENVLSLIARYGESKEFREVGHRLASTPTLSPIAVIKLARAYDYQSCEHDGWKNSVAQLWIDDQLIPALLPRIPGYSDAEWAI